MNIRSTVSGQAGDLHGGIEGVQPDMWDDPIFETRFRQFIRDTLVDAAGRGWHADVIEETASEEGIDLDAP